MTELEPTNLQRAQWARTALKAFTKQIDAGNINAMHPDDLEATICDLINDLLHFAAFHPRLNALAIHARARQTYLAEQPQEHSSDDTSADVALDALLNIKRIVGKSGDQDTDPFALLDLIEFEVYGALKLLKPT